MGNFGKCTHVCPLQPCSPVLSYSRLSLHLMHSVWKDMRVLGLLWPSPEGRTVKNCQFSPRTCHFPPGWAPICSAGFFAQCKIIQVVLYCCWTNNAIKLSYISLAEFLTRVIFVFCFWSDARVCGNSTTKWSTAKWTSGIYEQRLSLCNVLVTCYALSSCGFVLQGIWSRKTIENCQSDPVSKLWNCVLVYGKASTRDIQR